jgi:hypothetical protein
MLPGQSKPILPGGPFNTRLYRLLLGAVTLPALFLGVIFEQFWVVLLVGLIFAVVFLKNRSRLPFWRQAIVVGSYAVIVGLYWLATRS